ncbi:hypothetical protein EYB26_003149 [Talaromyces marneffei]|uniref:uncharacterized protein n=1 Tax=Talaromyces marneffei TaxID=37727 RepID=UPI0012A84C38|nr:uncharacterized protein EYB26_003149 [Talaromyces marneffei]QGA15491.1 hypothetical protein EYB26_003149 [Talaromyces marneffei]
MAYISSRPLSRLALQSRITHKSINSAQAAASANAVLRRYTSTSLSGISSRSKVSDTRASTLKSFNPRVIAIQNRGYAELKASGGKTEADLIVEELQELYDNAKDEFEIATDSTNGATIYAASDRESARELLDQLLYVYNVYTDMTRASAATGSGSPPQEYEAALAPNAEQTNADRLDAGATAAAGANPILDVNEALSGNSYVRIAPTFNPEYISVEVKEEVKKRVGQKVRELKSAVERLEEMAGHE